MIKKFIFLCLISGITFTSGWAQSWKLTEKNIDSAYQVRSKMYSEKAYRPVFHLTPPAGCMGDPNGGIYHNGWYHIFYGQQPFAFHPGAWFWGHARSKDLLHWEHMPNALTPAFELGLTAVGSGSTIVTKEGKKLAFHSASKGEGALKFWRTEFLDEKFTAWAHKGKNPVLTLEKEGLPPYDDFWRDPFVFSVEDRTFLIACADLFESDKVEVPIFEANNKELTDWEYKGTLFTVAKSEYRNLEVPEFRRIEDKWIFLASTDAPVDRVNYFLGDFDLDSLSFKVTSKGAIDYSGHYYAQETIQDSTNLFLMGWLPGWDREWLPYYMNQPLKNDNRNWNGCFAIPRKLALEDGELIQRPIEKLKELRGKHYVFNTRKLPVSNSVTKIEVLNGFVGDRMEIKMEFDLLNASFCGLNVLANKQGFGGLPIVWSGTSLNVDGVRIPIDDWNPGDILKMQIFVDRKFVEVFVNDGKYCISRQLDEENIKGGYLALTSLGGTAKLNSMDVWEMRPINMVSHKKP